MHEAIAAQNAIGGATAAMHPKATIAMAPAHEPHSVHSTSKP